MSLQTGNVTLMQQEEVDRKAIKAKRGPGVHSSFTLLLRAALCVSLIHFLLNTHPYVCTYTCSQLPVPAPFHLNSFSALS